MSDIRADPYSLAPERPLADKLTQKAFEDADEAFAILKDDVRLLKTAMTRGSEAVDALIQQAASPSTSSGISIPVPIEDGGTAATSASDARTNLGLGTIATQNASAVSVTGGTIAGVTTISATTYYGSDFYAENNVLGSMRFGAYTALSNSWALYATATTTFLHINPGIHLTNMSAVSISSSFISGGTVTSATITGGTISGLVTPLAIADGGTAATTAGGAVNNLGACSYSFPPNTLITSTAASSGTHDFGATSAHYCIMMVGSGGHGDEGSSLSTNSSASHSGAGGGGGELVIIQGKSTSSTMSYTIAAPGTASAGGVPGNTTVTIDGVTITAEGGLSGGFTHNGGSFGHFQEGISGYSDLLVTRIPGRDGEPYRVGYIQWDSSDGTIINVNRVAGAGGKSLLVDFAGTQYGQGGNGGAPGGGAGTTGGPGAIYIYSRT